MGEDAIIFYRGLLRITLLIAVTLLLIYFFSGKMPALRHWLKYRLFVFQTHRHRIPKVVADWVFFVRSEDLPAELKNLETELVHYQSDWKAFAYASSVFEEAKFRTSFEKLKLIWTHPQHREIFLKNLSVLKSENEEVEEGRSMDTMKKALLHPLFDTMSDFLRKYQEYYDNIEDWEDGELNYLLQQDFREVKEMKWFESAKPPVPYSVPNESTTTIEEGEKRS